MLLDDTPDALAASPIFMAASSIPIRMLATGAFARLDQLRPRTQRQDKPAATDPRSFVAAKARRPIGDLGILDPAEKQRQLPHRLAPRQFVEQHGRRRRRPAERTVPTPNASRMVC